MSPALPIFASSWSHLGSTLVTPLVRDSFLKGAAKGHGEHLKPFLSAEDAEGRGEHLFLSTKGHEENLCKGIIWSVHEGARRKPFVVDADHGRRSRESGEKRSDSARRRQKARSEGRGVREHLRSGHLGLGVLQVWAVHWRLIMGHGSPLLGRPRTAPMSSPRCT